MALINKRRLYYQIFIITIKTVLAQPGILFFISLDMLMIGEYIMQNLLRCNADSKNTYQKAGNKNLYESE